MADFCKQCSIDMWGEDLRELAGLGDGTPLPEGHGYPVICESCGHILVNEEGECISRDCHLHGHAPYVINKFDGTDYSFLSNFWESPLTYKGITWRSSENAYQAMKLPEEEWESMADVTPAKSKKMGRSGKVREDWDDVKVQIMTEILEIKFGPDTKERDMLLATGDAPLIEGNTWGDRFWGVCNGFGQNNLGKILMKIRENIRGSTDEVSEQN